MLPVLLHSGFNSALTLQVNATRQDVRITKRRLHEEAKQNREAQQSLINWSDDVEQERQLLFEALAYLNDDVQCEVPDILKIKSDIRRLRDFIAYKVDHADEEREQYLPKTPSARDRDETRSSYVDSDADLDSTWNLESPRSSQNIHRNQNQNQQVCDPSLTSNFSIIVLSHHMTFCSSFYNYG